MCVCADFVGRVVFFFISWYLGSRFALFIWKVSASWGREISRGFYGLILAGSVADGCGFCKSIRCGWNGDECLNEGGNYYDFLVRFAIVV